MAQYIYTMNSVAKMVPPKKFIIRDISLSFFPGAKIGVLGINGSGKSTLLRIMAGLDKEFDGEARPQAGIKIGYLPQEPELDLEKNVRQNVGVCDVTTLGKIDIKGPDAAELLNRVYTNAWLKLPVGKARYGVMLREDGIVMDDGTTTRISENHYHMTTTTAQAANVLSHLEYYLQLVWPELNVNVVSSTEQWAGAAIAGPKSRDVLQKLFPDLDVSNEGLPFMGYMEGNLFGVNAKIFRISFSGELAYEVNVESDNGNFMWEKIIEIGKEFNIQPYGTEALSTLRIEMGHVAGSELDGRTIPYVNSLEGLVSKRKILLEKDLYLKQHILHLIDRE